MSYHRVFRMIDKSIDLVKHASFESWNQHGWVHYSKIPQLTINPKQFHMDPAGIYLFPSKFKMAPFWKQHPYRFDVVIPPDLNVLDISKLNRTLALELLDKIGMDNEYYLKLVQTGDRYQDNFWESLQQKFTSKPGAFNKALRMLGFDAVFDDTKSIHSSEVQLILLNPSRIESATLVPAKGTGFKELEEIAKDLKDLLSEYGRVNVGRRKKKYEGWVGGNVITIPVYVDLGQDRYANWSVYTRPGSQSSLPSGYNVSLLYARPKPQQYGVGIQFDYDDYKPYELRDMITREMGKIMDEISSNAAA